MMSSRYFGVAVSSALSVKRYAGSLTMQPPNKTQGEALKGAEIRKLINKYIGVRDGYLGDFSYQKHRDFYADLDLDIDPDTLPGTTRLRFERILSDSPPYVQATIVQGILDRYPVGSTELRTSELRAEIVAWVTRLRSGGAVQVVPPTASTDVVRRALSDAEHLIEKSGATSAVDRVHTALHGYLLNLCSQVQAPASPNADTVRLLAHLRQHHPKLGSPATHGEEVNQILNSFASVLHVLNPIRNQASVAHPNQNLLAEPEAMLVVNAARTILNYLEARLKS